MHNQEISQQFTPLSHVKLRQEDKLEILSNLRREMSMESLRRERKGQRKRRLSHWTTGSAAATGGVIVAGVAIAAGVIVANRAGLIEFPFAHEPFGTAKRSAATSQASTNSTVHTADRFNSQASQLISMQSVRSMQMLNARVGWAWGDRAGRFALEKTVNGGQTWTDVTVPSQAFPIQTSDRPDNVHPYFINAEQGLLSWIDPNNATLTVLTTTDGGQHWNESSSQAATDVQGISNIQFINPNKGWIVAVSSPGAGNIGRYLYTTDDGGKTWTLTADSHQGMPTVGNMTHINFVSATEGWLALGNSAAADVELYHTTDGGKSWTNVGKSLQPPAGYQNVNVDSVYAPVFSGTQSQQGVFVAHLFGDHNGSTQGTPVIYTTHDGGQSWTPRVMSGLGQAMINRDREPATFLDAQTGWTMQKETLYRTLNGGQSWQSIPSATLNQAIAAYPSVSELDFVSSSIGWILLDQPSNNQSALLKTSDGGSTWSYETKTTASTNSKVRQIISKAYSTLGTIVDVHETANELHSIDLKVEKNIKGADSAVDDPNFPFKIGSTVSITFDEPLAEAGAIQPKSGDEVILTVSQFVTVANQTPEWGSTFTDYAYKQDGKFYNRAGAVVPQ